MPKIQGARLSAYTTFRLGGACRFLIDCTEASQLIGAIQWARECREPFVLIGGGSNLLVADAGYPGVVVRYFNTEPDIVRDGDHILVSGSTVVDDLARWLVREGLDGLMCLSGIPGTVGGAVVGNAGAWGEQIGDRVDAVHLLAGGGEVRWAPAAEMGFAYRHSRLQESGEMVLAVRLNLEPGNPERLREKRREILAHRAARHPDLSVNPCAGSFFRNIEATSAAERRQAAGYFLEQAGVKDLQVGGARVYAGHANIIIHGPGCTARDVFILQGKMQQLVRETFGLELVREVRFLGPFEKSSPRDGFY